MQEAVVTVELYRREWNGGEARWRGQQLAPLVSSDGGGCVRGSLLP